MLLLFYYIVNLNRLLSATPSDFAKLISRRWTRSEIKNTYARLSKNPITTASYASQLPPKQHRRYIITGGSGLVGGYIVLQLLERGQPPSSIRIVDFQAPHRADMLSGRAAKVDFQKADISSATSTEAAFAAPWDDSVASLPLTVFHTAAVIIPSARSELVNGFCESVNVLGTEHVVAAARRAGADVLIATSSASIAIRPVEFWTNPFTKGRDFPRYFSQVLDESDFFRPLRPHHDFFGNYPASKAKAERIVCGANGDQLRTGCIRPANGVYGHPTDNLIGSPLNMQTYPQWVSHIIQSFVHGVNCAVAHLQFEAILAEPGSSVSPQAGRPFCVTDPNPPIYYGDLHNVIATLSCTPFRLLEVPPAPMLLLAYAVEFYNLLPARLPWLRRILPALPGAVVYLEPGLFSICTHLVGNMDAACRPVDQGGLGYRGVLTTLDGMCQELLDWNHEQGQHAEEVAKLGVGSKGKVGMNSKVVAKYYRNSVALAEEIRKLGAVGVAVKA
ncbi:NAD(P)-binding protein [Cryphonectria parasitica EP155]|uniref:NAD(P)-binding protein n=1 Tax=Cryphonectria parasitica (strain ATCC 38755 / EP155) TaxID=660469 RepID=A0A9P4XSA1_CRYP1|nr:NAD(P)-binding protein [Cryphonectria parasitica EP155]KAF3760033.1 NAD(P)-binding protein [Cryphonectria parasitica EP155]